MLKESKPKMQKISTCFWFDGQAEEAVNLYTSIFKNSKILETQRYSDTGPGEPGSVMTINFQIEGQEFIALNGGPDFKFNEAISMFVNCESQDEVDFLWEKLTEGGREVQCGWLTDKFGVSWQIVPTELGRLLGDPDPAKVVRVTQAMLQMVKLDIAALQRAYEGENT